MRSEIPGRFSSIPSATGALARLACARLREGGKDVTAILAKAGARPEQVDDDAIRLEVSKQMRILELVSDELQDGLLGFHVGRDFDLRELGLVYYVIASSANFSDALLNGRRYSKIMNDGVRLLVKIDRRVVAIALEYVDVDRQSDRHQIEFWLTALVRICRKVTATRLAPLSLRIKHRRGDTPEEMRKFFGCDVEFGAASDEISFPASIASLPMVNSDSYLNELLRRYAEEALEGRPKQRNSVRSEVEHVLPELLPHAKANASNVAQKLALSRRTLSRS